MAGIASEAQILIEVEHGHAAACAEGCQANLPPLPHEGFQPEHCCEEDGAPGARLDASALLGLAGVVARNFAYGILTTAPGLGVLALLAKISSGGDRAPLLCAACAADVLVHSAIIFLGGLQGLFGVRVRGEDVLLSAPIALLAGTVLTPPLLLAYFQWVPHWEFVNRQCLAFFVLMIVHEVAMICLRHGAVLALGLSAQRPREPWWRRGSPIATARDAVAMIITYVAPPCITIVGASIMRYWLSHECRHSGWRHYALIMGFLAWQVGTTSLLKRFMEWAATKGQNMTDIVSRSEMQMGPMQTTKLCAAISSLWVFPMALGGKLLVTALQSWREALVMSSLNLLVEVAETVSALRAARSAAAPTTEAKDVLEAIQQELAEPDCAALKEGLSRYRQRLAEQRRAMALASTKVLANQLGEYALMTAAVGASLIFAGHPLVDGFSNGRWSPTDALLFLIVQFIPELLCDFICLAYVRSCGVDVQALHAKVHMDPALLGIHAVEFLRFLVFAALAAQKRSWGA